MKKIIILAILLAIFGLVYGAYRYLHQAASRVFISSSSSKSVSNQPWLASHLDSKTPFSVLFLGYGGGTHDGGELTDSMLLVRVDPSLKTIFLISIPRDIWLTLPTGLSKINAAYPISPDAAKTAVQTVTGLPVDRFVALDFAGFTQSIDVLGGVDVQVTTTFDDYEYPIDGKEDDLCGHSPDELASLVTASATSSAAVFPCRYEHLHFDQGLQHMDGVTALKYVRSRHSLQDGTDFGRSNRQRNFLVAVRSKILNPSILVKILPLVNSLQDHLTTDVAPSDLQVALLRKDELSGYTIKSLALTDQNLLVDSFSSDGQAILLPTTGLDQWNAVHDWLANQTSSHPTNLTPSVQVENGSGIPGLAEQVTADLINQHFHTVPPANYPSSTVAHSFLIISDSSVDPQIVSGLTSTYGPVATDPSLTPHQNQAYDILIVLGQDYHAPKTP